MRKILEPKIFHDRMPFPALEKESLKTVEVLKARGFGKYGQNETVQFCGLAIGERSTSTVFLPRQSMVQDKSSNLETAKLTMKVLAKYGKETPTRLGSGLNEIGGPSLIAVISEIAEDFKNFGLFSDRQRYRSKDDGKPDWKRTVLREIPFQSLDEAVVYGHFHTTRSRDSRSNGLAQIQAFVLREIIEHHSWWINGIVSRRSELNQVNVPTVSLKTMVAKLRAMRTEIYAIRSLRLIENLINYLGEASEVPEAGTLLGVNDFHTVWEHMLRKTYSNVEDGWNSRLPVAQYVVLGGSEQHVLERGMQTDLVVRNNSHLTVVDAKYYDAKTIHTAPRWPDIVKQMYYDLAIRTLVEKNETVSGCFIFPSQMNGVGKYESVQVVDRSTNAKLQNFPEIQCLYRDIKEVMSDYVFGQSRDFLPPSGHTTGA